MATESGLDLKKVIDVLRNGRTTDWALDEDKELQKELGGLVRTKLEFTCRLQYKKVKPYEIDAREFLSFAKEDLEDDSARGRINALSNAKRAIECRIDEILTLFNLKPFTSRQRLNLPLKIQFLQTLSIPAPNILRRLTVKKRNSLEHDYIMPDREETQDAVEVAELFLKATDPEVERGYIASATIQDTKWFPDEEPPKFPYQHTIGMANKYELIFDLNKGELTLKESYLERYREETRSRSKESPSSPSDEKSTSMPIPGSAMEDIRELMILLRKRASEGL